MSRIRRICVVLIFLEWCGLAKAQTVRQKAGENRQNAPTIEAANVLFRYSPELSVLIVGLRGALIPTEGHTAPSFNEPASFVIGTDAAEIRMTTAQLSALMNSWLLSSPEAQIRDVRIAAAGDQLLIQGTMKKGVRVPFRAAADVGVTEDNRIRFTVRKVQAADVPVKGLMDALGVTLEKLVSQKGLKGMSVEEDSFLIDPQTAFPPPQVRAKISSVRVSGQSLMLLFGTGTPKLAARPEKNYIALRGGSVEYGREEMFDSDLMMIDTTPADPFEFYLSRYWCQMVAGRIRVTPDKALRIEVPDFSKLRAGACAR